MSDTSGPAGRRQQSQDDMDNTEPRSSTPSIKFFPGDSDDRVRAHHEFFRRLHQPNQYTSGSVDSYKQNIEAGGADWISPPTSETAGMLHDLHIKTDVQNLRRRSSVGSTDVDPRMISSASAASFTHRIPSVRSWLHSTAGSVSPGSVFSSPQIAAMLDITPLPSPTMGPLESIRHLARTRSRASSTSSKAELPGPISAPVASTISPASPRKKLYAGLQSHIRQTSDEKGTTEDEGQHNKNRSVSDYVPDTIAIPKPRNHAVSTTGPPQEQANAQIPMHREEFLGTQRGLATHNTIAEQPFPPKFNPHALLHEDEPATKRPKTEVYTASSINTGHLRQYESIRLLGQGTFSKVHLAVRQVFDRKDSVDYRQESTNMAGIRARSRRLVAVKVVEPGPAGGADADRIEISLKREVDLMKSIQHPSIVHLKAFGTDASGRALLVMNYCPGGDLFELTSTELGALQPPLVRRIFSELVSAVRYLHQKYIVHRDIKLENVLLNIPVQVHSDVPDWQTLDRAVVTLTDLGLSRRIPPPPESPLLETRCGSEDYAAPEILMGQPYDGRQTDAWALGVLLYTLVEGRLPFDPRPGARGDPATLKARTPHRIARCEWSWVRYGDEDGDWDAAKGAKLEGARKCVDALLKRNTRRVPLADIREWPWVKDGIQVDGGLRRVEEEGI